MIIRSRVPVRISFGGGGTDVSPFCEKYGGGVLNATINRYIWATIETRTDKQINITSFDLKKNIHYRNIKQLSLDKDLDIVKVVIQNMPGIQLNFGFNFYLRSDIPAQSGLGGSAAAFIACIGVFNYFLKEKKLSKYEIAELAYRLEREVLGNPGGRQDQYASVFGGVNFVEFKGDDFVRVNPLNISLDNILELEKHLVLINVGPRQKSGNVILDQVKRFQAKKNKSVEGMLNTKKLALEMKYALMRGDLYKFGNLLNQAWLEKKKFSPLITNARINRLYSTALKNGALGGKITGAGGGGHMLFLAQPNQEQKLKSAFKKMGIEVIYFNFDFHGLVTWEVKSKE